MKEYKVFCKDCGTEITTPAHYDYDHDSLVYECEDCGLKTTAVAVAEFAIGDVVHWEDPCNEDYTTNEDYEEACEQLRTITNVSYDGDSFIYELDNGTEVYEEEVFAV